MKLMSFGTLFREFREEYLKIKQVEAALLLEIDQVVLSNYERGKREFPLTLLPKVKEIFHIPDDIFLAMVLNEPLKEARDQTIPFPEQAKEVQDDYTDSFASEYSHLIEQSPELRELLLVLSHLSEKDRRDLLNSFKGFTEVFQHTLERLHEAMNERTDDA
ncbi:hypothetical protein GOP80_01645 [Planococcaceae bacterium Storch 2/2-2]|nr:hypothetical protein [Planococcaceae bacterium Storch 2/2-2]